MNSPRKRTTLQRSANALQRRGKKGEKRNGAVVKKKSSPASSSSKSRYPEHLLVKRRSGIPVKRRHRHRRHVAVPEVYRPTGALIKRQDMNRVENFTALNGEGIDRLYNQLATSAARIAPTFDDDAVGWSPSEVKNVMKQLHPDIEGDMTSLTNGGGGKSAGFDDATSSENRRRVESPTSAPVSENDVNDVETSTRHHHKSDTAVKSSVFSKTYVNNRETVDGDRQTDDIARSNFEARDVHFKNGDFIGAQTPDNYDENFLDSKHSK